MCQNYGGLILDIKEFNRAMEASLGECGSEAVIDAINYYLLNNKDFPCEEDKLILLSILYDSPYSCGINAGFNAVLKMHIDFCERD